MARRASSRALDLGGARMKFLSIPILLVGAALIAYVYRKTSNVRERERLLAELAALPAFKRDFSTPEGAILCLQYTYPRRDIEAAVACRDFATEARIWLQEQGDFTELQQLEMLPGMTTTMESAFRESHAESWPPGWDRARSYLTKREPYGQGLVAVSEVSVGPEGSLFRQSILVSETPKGWRVVTPLVKGANGWRVVAPKAR